MFLLLALVLLLALPDPWNAVAALAALAAWGLEVFYFYRRMRREKVVTGVENLVGAVGKAVEPLQPEGHVRVHGELWEARSPTPIESGARVEVVAVEDLTLEVRPAESAAGAAAKAAGSMTLLVVLVLSLAACGGDDESASEEYANGVCSSLSSWVTDVQETVQSLTDAGLGTTREDIQAAFDETKDATDTLVNDLEELGTPETEDGQQARSEIDDLTTELRTQLDVIEQALDSGEGVTAIAATVSTAVSTAANAVNTTYQDLQGLDPGGELSDAFESSEDCDSLRDQLDEIGSEGER
jgi:membrane protein implicated in regulation of membrane protease activity